ncbi:MAG: type IV conjugative transfer system protein TraL [Gammaproteobacteria bacterium RIFCSPHIGHO2_02_FULL_39_13]|nr:MAG: type IV conjugative transfer system protein TraL [Gammaproteobacteria bacterium RIFCSPHIGHO2_02_FULL_39_13]
MDKRSLYIVCKTLDQPVRVIGLPLDEFILMAAISGIFFMLGKPVLAAFLGLMTIIALRIMKKGQGSGWLLNVCYWYLPEIFLKAFLRFTPASHKREWIS